MDGVGERIDECFDTVRFQGYSETIVSFESDHKNYRTMNVMRRNRSFIVAIPFGSKNQIQLALSSDTSFSFNVGLKFSNFCFPLYSLINSATNAVQPV